MRNESRCATESSLNLLDQQYYYLKINKSKDTFQIFEYKFWESFLWGCFKCFSSTKTLSRSLTTIIQLSNWWNFQVAHVDHGVNFINVQSLNKIKWNHLLLYINKAVRSEPDACNFIKKRDSGTDVFLWILRNYKNTYFEEANGCFWLGKRKKQTRERNKATIYLNHKPNWLFYTFFFYKKAIDDVSFCDLKR